ncbi:hypothetical protein N2152v2_007798 [Parachlorella kessleri]
MQGFVIIGHSTGCQDALRYSERYRSDVDAASLLGVVLQAPVSDREWLATQPDTAARLSKAADMIQTGQGEETCFRAHDVDGAAVTARRWQALASEGGDDDYFSSDLNDDQLKARLFGVSGLPTLLLLSGADEYVPPDVDYKALGRRLQAAVGASARLSVVEGGLHALGGHEQQAVDEITAFLRSL